MTGAIPTSTIGYPRIGPAREMKKALESYWSGKISQESLLSTAREVDENAWKTQADAGIDLVALDGTLYDHIADFAIQYLGLVPPRFQRLSGLDQYFAAARGVADAPALDMSKLLDTNYHYLAPELTQDSTPKANWEPFLDRVKRGQATIGKDKAVPLVVGPLSIVGLARGEFDKSAVLSRLVPAYKDLLEKLVALGVPEVQIHEPVLALGSASGLRKDAESAYSALASAGAKIHMVVPYDDVSADVYEWLVALPVAAIGLDFCGVPGAAAGNKTAQLIAQKGFPKDKRLGVGVIDGRSVWADNGTAAAIVAALRDVLGPDQQLTIQTSTSLQHVPLDLSLEGDNIPSDVKPRLAFARQKLDEIVAVAKGSAKPSGKIDAASYTGAPQSKADSSKYPEDYFNRPTPYESRRPQQPQFEAFPTTTIGSFPQTPAIRRARLQYKKGQLSETEYRERMAAEIGYAIGMQDALGLDVLVHGEPERSDMVEFFGRLLVGFVFTEHGWVQSYGSRYVRPPIISGDVKRTGPMTVHEFSLAQGLTQKFVKGMLTGPVTILNWSFPRKDISRSEQAFQIAMALREEIADLEKAGCRILQVDEPALREGLPLKEDRAQPYLDWATAAFRLACGVASPPVQIVTHLCYSQFEEILPAIDALDADVLTIENSRSSDEMVHALASYGYPRDVGPGVYDVHSPVVPTVEFMANKARAYLKTGILDRDATRIWVNPDCGLKTRRWEEVIPALKNSVEAARQVREEISNKSSPK